ncbi:helix-hairpin-helix domain-containing protein [Prevotella sp. PTAC]|uniref:helix-hairpin-helix domain-containing protein n=1 Tax=Prevotella sp. PTAC TaxID=2736295 RepID=UPI00155578D5|nr:helix-hairpin-helix domain-containing protein [Prevotella sp. PTAC]NPD53856.1 helix-hairpin-helix domain-containing protein [Prevotella sp. PTAC]
MKDCLTIRKYVEKKALCLLFLFVPVMSAAQQGAGWEAVLGEMAALEDEPEAAFEEMHDVLSAVAEHPININAAGRTGLERLPFLTDRQIEDIQEYIGRHGVMRTTGELQMIPSLDNARRRLLECLVYAGEPPHDGRRPLSESIKNGRHTLVATAKIPFYSRKGDINGYLGYPFKHWFRYDFDCGYRLRAGVVGAHDAGEPFFSAGNNTGYDYYSYYVVMRDIRPFETIAVGKYRFRTGMGLVLGNSFGIGKTAALSGSSRSGAVIRGHSSRSEAGYFRGAAATARLSRRIKAGVFVSHRPMDATLNADGTAATIITSGYHRRPEEMAKKNNTHAAAAGLTAAYSSDGIHVGATAVYTRLDRQLRPKTGAVFRQYYAAGSDFVNLGLDYGYIAGALTFRGETATDRHGAIATINTVGVTVAGGLSLTAVQRFYSYRYTSLYAGGFSDGGSIRNESGLYLAADWNISRRVSLSAYTDFAYFPWPRYRVSGSSKSADNMLSASYKAGAWTVGGRYRLRLRERDNEQKTALVPRTEHRARVSAVYAGPAGYWNCAAQTDFSQAGGDDVSRGWMFSGRVGHRRPCFSVSLSAAYFDTDDYDSRVYLHESGILHTFCFPSFHGNGIHCSLFATASVWSGMTVNARLAHTAYFDRSTIGSGYQAIDSSSVIDLEVQARMRF